MNELVHQLEQIVVRLDAMNQSLVRANNRLPEWAIVLLSAAVGALVAFAVEFWKQKREQHLLLDRMRHSLYRELASNFDGLVFIVRSLSHQRHTPGMTLHEWPWWKSERLKNAEKILGSTISPKRPAFSF